MIRSTAPASLVLLTVLPLSGCCGLCNDDDGKSDPGANPGSTEEVQPLPLSECKAVSNNIGTWRPSTKVLGRAARAIPNETCISANQVAATLASCAGKANSATVEASVEPPGYTACSHTSRALTWNDRHWISITAFVGVGGSFHGQSYIYEIVNDNPVAAYTGFAGASELCSPDTPSPSNKTSPKLEADWPSMPADVRKFFCE